MRAGGYTVQQALTAEAAGVVKQAVTLARRRGHAQVTPLHVAHTMLSASTGLFRTACLQSNSHPLQCRALELCFNVSLNRLPACSSSPVLGPHHSQHPSISNALVAAFKRAQAHQRRGSVENQQQPLLAVKIELDQLIISILDDPSVSRVMREAGFSSTQVKSNVEQAISLEVCSQTPPASISKSKESNLLVLSKEIGVKGEKSIRNEDVASVMENLMNKRRRSTVIVGECVSSIEGVVRAVMEKFDKGDVPEALRDVKFVSLPLFSIGHFSREEVEQKLGELRCLVKSCAVGSGAVLYLGDLKWATEFGAISGREVGGNYYPPAQDLIVELGKLVCGIGESGRFWLMGIATFQTYMRCRSGHPSLETLWALHALTIPAGSLGLSLIPDSDSQSQSRNHKDGDGSTWLLLDGGEDKQVTCCSNCSPNFETQARSLQSNSTCNSDSNTSSLPAWLQKYKDENKKLIASSNDQNCVPATDLCKKWNSICTSVQRQPNSSERTITLSSASPSSSTSGFSYDQQYPIWHQTHQVWPMVNEHYQQSWRKKHFWNISEAANSKAYEPTLRMYIPEHRDPKQALSSNPNSTPNSASSSDVIMETECAYRFKELNAENLKTLCNALEKKVPWQKDILPEIASTILKCRSGIVRRKGKAKNGEAKEETWLFFQGFDMEAKERIARELARLVFGSQIDFVSITLSSFSSTRADSTEDLRNKRAREEQSCSYLERFAEAVASNPHRVFLVEDVEQADYCSQMGFKRAAERGRITNSNGDEIWLRDAIIILSCESFSSRSRACSPPIRQKSGGSHEEEKDDHETSPCVSLDLNISIGDHDTMEDHSIDDIGLLESVDKRIIFKTQVL
ncbi:protein SMAX1-LIKE 3 [Malania oleifera]|uniref:protein SMAX1-LIKE 3 n=1 Tax=Malania oleifera TaxID=397392 RepID=UPI0025AE76FC|nr:protein SMAX1-LIKE 3 [Malania oleifera]